MTDRTGGTASADHGETASSPVIPGTADGQHPHQPGQKPDCRRQGRLHAQNLITRSRTDPQRPFTGNQSGRSQDPLTAIRWKPYRQRGKHSLHGTASEFILTGQHASAAIYCSNYIQSSGPHALTLDFESPLELTTDHLLRAQPAKIQALITTFLPRGALQSQLTGTVDSPLDSSTLDTTLAGLFDGAELSFSGRQEGFLKPKRTASLALARLDLNRYLPEPDGPLAPLLNSRQKINLGWLTRQDFSGRFVIGELRIGHMADQQIDADITANRNGIDIPRLSAAIYQGSSRARPKSATTRCRPSASTSRSTT